MLARRATGVTDRDTFTAWLTDHGYTSWTAYQPDSRFWLFQTLEASTYVLLAVLIGVATLWWIRRRAS